MRAAVRTLCVDTVHTRRGLARSVGGTARWGGPSASSAYDLPTGDLERTTCVVGPAASRGKGKGKGKDRPCAGTVTFEQDGGAACVIEWDLTGLSPGLHALAIHEHAVFDAGLAGAGARYNPHKAKLGGPYTVEKRVGDLGTPRCTAP